jgi:hypothetical protein
MDGLNLNIPWIGEDNQKTATAKMNFLDIKLAKNKK